MVNLPTSHSEKNYERLDSRIQKWIWEKGWDDLRDIQEQAIPAILNEKSDLILSATTASGKTEAAFLPLLTDISKNEQPGYRILYISPLKALINDQFDRLEDLAGRIEMKVTPWHGDIDQQVKRKSLRSPSGIVLITPESFESLLDRHAADVSQAFVNLEAIVIDEVHAFIGSERGKQLQSLLSRLEQLIGQRIRRIGLSATLGNMNIASEYLRPEDPESVKVIISHGDGFKLKISLNGILKVTDPHDSSVFLSKRQIAEDIFSKMRSEHHLVFANSRSNVEEMAFLLRGIGEKENVPCDFFPHHGSLNKELREDAESRLKNPNMPATAICTSTLELGIDIGQVKSIAQIGPPPSVASLRQRIGRSGRRGEPAILRNYIEELPSDKAKALPDALRLDLIRSMAHIELMLERWVETPRANELHLSTLVHQVLALICERGSIQAGKAYEVLCAKGVFRNVSIDQFVDLLRCMGQKDLIVQSHDGDLVIGLVGEKITSSYEFFAVFLTPQNYELVADGRRLGELSPIFLVLNDMTIIFAGRSWRVTEVDSDKKIIYVVPAPGGKVPIYESMGWLIDDKILEKEKELFLGLEVPKYLDPVAIEFLQQGREAFKKASLDKSMLAWDDGYWLMFPWKGTRVAITIQLMFSKLEIKCERIGEHLYLKSKEFPKKSNVIKALERILITPEMTPEKLSGAVKEKKFEKYHWVLNEGLLTDEFSLRFIEVDKAFESIREIIKTEAAH